MKRVLILLSSVAHISCAPIASTHLRAVGQTRTTPVIGTYQNVGFAIFHQFPDYRVHSFTLLDGTVSTSSGYSSPLRIAPDQDLPGSNAISSLYVRFVPQTYPTRNEWGIGIIPPTARYDVALQCRIDGRHYTLQQTFAPHTSWQIITPADLVPNVGFSRAMQ